MTPSDDAVRALRLAKRELDNCMHNAHKGHVCFDGDDFHEALFAVNTALAASQPEATVQSAAPRWQELAIQCLRDALKDVEAIGVELPRHGIDVLGYFINRLNASPRQAEPVDRVWVPCSICGLRVPESDAKAAAPSSALLHRNAQPPADLKDAQRYRWLRQYRNGTLLVVKPDSYEGDTILSIEELDAAIDDAMLSSAPTGEKP